MLFLKWGLPDENLLFKVMIGSSIPVILHNFVLIIALCSRLLNNDLWIVWHNLIYWSGGSIFSLKLFTNYDSKNG